LHAKCASNGPGGLVARFLFQGPYFDSGVD